ncbi:MAG TPA: serine/threonine-protein kinase [Bryobacteraceae bacterium]|jgi:serine/threonine-protein kinase
MATPQDRDILSETGSITPQRFAQVRAIFEAAVERPLTERRAFAAGACAGDPDLLHEVEAMLVADAHASPLLDKTTDRNAASSAPEEGRFPAGTVLAGRYRILGLLGRGGMGEVYKAFDLILNQTVALKFLAPTLISEAALVRFRNEVRIARQVSHPNVCRVYDLGMVDGLHFLSMEYIDGEDLASLLRRIGRLPQDKAIEFTRKICAGLGAAHERGVLHRDLKPANIMIDRRGQVRITDFGLAGIAAEIPLSDLRSGTPAYMSPEQKAGKEVTTRSDIYALGLVLHEMFTGKARHQTQSSPTELVKDLDPTIERIILRCLEDDPKRRPNSSVSVAMGLPGADPIAAALAAGETPSPEMVAASNEKEGFSSGAAWVFFVTAVVGVAISLFLSWKTSLLSRVPIRIPGDALAFKAQELLKELGYTETPVDTAYSFTCCNLSTFQTLNKLGPSRRDQLLATGYPVVLWFYYRQHQDEFLSDQFLFNDPFPTTGFVGELTPPNSEPGMLWMRLLPDGRLVFLEAVAKEVQGEFSKRGTDPASLFAAAGLDLSRFTPSAPVRLPPVPFDTRLTWTGTYAPDRAEPVTVQAAWWRGKPVYFNADEARMQFGRPPRPRDWVLLALFVVVLTGGVSVAHHNFRLGRGDRAGAMRLAVLAFFLTMLAWSLTAHHVARPWEILLIVRAISWALFVATALWCMYVAIEPYARRNWPESLISWTRFQQKHIRSPLVASHMLAGVAIAVAHWAGHLVLRNLTSTIEIEYRIAFLSGGFHAAAEVVYYLSNGLFFTMGTLLLLVLSRLALRRVWIGDTVFVLLVSAAQFQAYAYLHQTIILWLWEALTVVAYLWMFRRCGVLSFTVYGFLVNIMRFPPVDWSSWYAARALLVQLIPLAIAGWALWVVLSARNESSPSEAAA